jgi:hypothetical protein
MSLLQQGQGTLLQSKQLEYQEIDITHDVHSMHLEV